MSKLYGTAYTPLVARIQRNRRDATKRVAFIGRQLCFLDRRFPLLDPGAEVEVMVVQASYGVHPTGHDWAGSPDRSVLRGLMIQPVDRALHALVAIDGFECSGSMCRTTAHGRETDGSRALTAQEAYPSKRPGESRESWLARDRGSMWLTPGRVDVTVADNVNARFYDRQPTPLRPMNVWVERSRIAETSGCGVRVLGLSTLDDADWSPLVTREQAQVRQAA